MIYKNIFLNCVLLSTVVCYSANAWYCTGPNCWSESEDYHSYEQLNIGENEPITLNGMNLTNLTMTDSSSLTLNGGGYVDEMFFSGNVVDNASSGQHYPVTMFSTKTTFNNVDITGGYDPTKNIITWGDQTSFWSNELVLTGDVKMSNVQVGMSSGSVKGVEFFDGAVAFDPFKSNYDAGTLVVWNGGLYKTKENQHAFKDEFYADLANKVSDGTLTQLNEMDQYTSIVGIGQSYESGDVFQVIGTNAFFKSVGLIEEYEDGQDSTPRIMAFRVSENKTFDTLTPADIMVKEQLPIDYQSGVTIKDADVYLYRTSIMAHQEIDPLQRVAMGAEFADIRTRINALDNLSQDDLEFIQNLNTLDMSCGPDEFWNQLREYYYDKNYTNPDIKQAFKETDKIHTKYLIYASVADTLPVTIKNSTVVAGNSSLQKHDSGNFVVDNSNVTLYGIPDPLTPNEQGGSMGSLNHLGATGDIIIRNNSELNLYPYSNLHREGNSGNIYFIGSTINMRSNDTKYLQKHEIDLNDIDDLWASVHVNNGNVQLTDGSVLNVYGDNNGFNLPEPKYDFSAQNWQEQLKATSLYVNNSTINIKEDSFLGVVIDTEDEEEPDTIKWNEIKRGIIAMDTGSIMNIRGWFEGDIVSINTDTDAGIVNLYDNATVIGGKIHRANIFVNPGAEKETVNIYGKLSLQDSTLDIGTHTLNIYNLGELLKAEYGENFRNDLYNQEGIVFNDNDLTVGLYLNNSTIITHIDLKKNDNGMINVEQLEFGEKPSLVKVIIDDGVLNPQGATFDFLTGDTDIGDNLTFSNVMYDIKYDNGKLILVPNGNSGIISLDALNDRIAATGWLSGGFAEGSKAKMIADALNEWAQTDPESFKKAIKQIQPDTTSSQQTTAQSTNNQIVNAVGHHMGHGNGGHNGNGHHDNGLHLGHDKDHHDNGYRNGGNGPRMGRSGGDTFENVSVWAQGLYNKSKLNTANGFDGDTYGFALGTDTKINKNLSLGLGYAYTNSDIDTESRNTDVESHTAILYGQYDFGDAFVNGITTYGFNRYEEQSDINAAKYNMDSIFAQATTGYNFYVNSLGLTPQTGIKYLWTNTHGYTDSTEQYISGNKTNTLTGVLGASASMDLQSGSVILQPSVRALATYDMMKNVDDVNVMLANGSSYIISGSKSNRFGTEFGVGLNVNYDTFDLSLNYGIEIRENYTSQTGMLRAKYNF